MDTVTTQNKYSSKQETMPVEGDKPNSPLETFSALQWDPKEFSQLPVAFGYLENRKESRCIAAHRQGDFNKRVGKLFLAVPSTLTNHDISRRNEKEDNEVMDCEIQERCPATKDDIEKYRNQITVEVSYMSALPDCKRRASPEVKASTSSPSFKKTKSGSFYKGTSKKTPKSADSQTKVKSKLLIKKNFSSKKTPTKKSTTIKANSKKNIISNRPLAKEIACIPAPEPEFANTTGWIRKEFRRASGATKGDTDRYWYTPKKKIKIRSMKQCRAFLKCLTLTDPKGDEDAAWLMVKHGLGT